MKSYSVGKWSRLSYHKFACQKVLKQYRHKSVFRIKQKLKKGTLTHLSAQKKSWPKFYIFWKVQLERKGFNLKVYLTK